MGSCAAPFRGWSALGKRSAVLYSLVIRRQHRPVMSHSPGTPHCPVCVYVYVYVYVRVCVRVRVRVCHYVSLCVRTCVTCIRRITSRQVPDCGDVHVCSCAPVFVMLYKHMRMHALIRVCARA